VSETLPELLTAAQVAERWSCSQGHLANMRSAGVGPIYLKLGGSVRYRVSDLLAYETAAEVAPVA
jgi:hypothetical protein